VRRPTCGRQNSLQEQLDALLATEFEEDGGGVISEHRTC